ncbi:phenylacetic acid degradation bifunctional protein PaaZ [Amphiplicatus metriothermophilus]|uniref:Oxepin-CoA hydrolase / 3-oxo-5,6-dehydrosuberyl-CoA semialdehyde dehydrogenase n=1 Tax=Amphiplicatus metriothermophilus TaxID=1519374 RepID=A0A239PX34_9PROT|nr:phenylacetic acid degradation bifunctional protein PaaZ [Amphiplicatus metriothermophilus]MBB5519674.1 oxepin-CoA hydrolase/3-oxo-5,6-dehydrosuberyl-CoA semialdehyde dehydrogenase [Amphiplicatus metriothermophilus]SNT74237.1 oxepin-CoA hydrolase / 3-oxo-5,6-dehydrosuberyl-CoA semialdehyde dehydrogenase [Amphiplicatus metriothermophilus]
MSVLTLKSYVADEWVDGGPNEIAIASAVTGETAARAGTGALDFAAMVRHAREVGGPALRAMTFHERAAMLKGLAKAIMDRKEALYALNPETGATRKDGWIDIEGGAGTLFSYASKGKRELPDDRVLIDGEPERISREGTFMGLHVFTPLQGFALHVNAFNFPVWGMLEKLGPTLLAGVPAIVKPATATAYLAEAAFRILIETGLLPKGAVQLVIGPTGDLFDRLTGQDVVSFTGSASTAQKLRAHPRVIAESARFIAEQDSLNASVLGPDAEPGSPEFDLFIKEVVREMTVKAGQKCTAIRRAFVPEKYLKEAEKALAESLARIKVGDPALEEARMGALVSHAQREDVRDKVRALAREADIVFGDLEKVEIIGERAQKGAFISPILLRCDDPWTAKAVHVVEAFGPVSTLMPYRDLEDAAALANRGEGSLVASLFTHDPKIAREFVLAAGAYHGRLAIIDRDSAKESTGHGSPLPVLVHGGPGRAGGGEEMGGARGVKHYMQRTALQGSPAILTGVANSWIKGAPVDAAPPHPFRLKFGALEIGKTIETKPREITLDDIEHFAHFTGDTFYAHMDEEAARANPFFPGRVAHGYLILSFAAGLFVDPAPGPVLANYGLDNLRFLAPVSPGDSIKVRLTAKSKKKRNDDYGEVRWDVEVANQKGETVATYELLTMNAV